MAKPLISVETIYDAALQLLDEQGPKALSARNLAARLQCSTRTLYQQVGKREELIDKLVDHYLAGLKLEFHQGEDWQESTRAWALTIRQALLEHPNLASLMTTKHRGPIVGYVNTLLKILLQAGFGEEIALRSCRVLVNVAISLSLSEIQTPPLQELRKKRSKKEVEFETAILSKRGGGKDRFQAPGEIFTQTVDWIVAGMEQELAQKKG
jgi:AcrR family transcriptional regulator